MVTRKITGASAGKERKKPRRKPAAKSAAEVRVVGIGSSAGGLEALRELIECLPAESAMCYVIAQHMSPSHMSMLADLLAPRTNLSVRNVVDGERPSAGVIYVTTPSHDVALKDGKLRLMEPQQAVGPKPSVNHFFLSLAEEQGEKAIGIILSGTGSDGSVGMRAIKAAGGIVLVQDPESAKYDGMPKAAIQTANVDLILRPSEMGDALVRLLAYPGSAHTILEEDSGNDAYSQIANIVRLSTGFRLADYKSSTVRRRIARRMNITGLEAIEDYIVHLRADKKEAQALVRDTFISVTSFFRDEVAFSALKQQIDRLVREYSEDGVLRCWVPGCASGEEPYSIAMLLEEAIREHDKSALEYIIFASDLDEDALEAARRGSYSLAELESIPATLRERYTERSTHSGSIIKSLRNRVIFARQNVLEDPPFARLHLVSCRNLLIYLNPPVQEQLFQVFHFALKPGGMLFLGKAENADSYRNMFTVEDQRARIYRRAEGLGHLAILPTRGVARGDGSGRGGGSHNGSAAEAIGTRAVELLAQRFAPASVVINQDERIVYFSGDLAPFLTFPQGPVEWNFFDLLKEGPRAEMRALVYRCRRETTPLTGSAWTAEIDGSIRVVVPHIAPLNPNDKSLLLLSFAVEDAPERPEHGTRTGLSGEENDLVIRELENELASTRVHLNIVVEELETSNEELHSLNEELQSSNEELQSSNEELQTTNEELQSTNEELLTVNEEIQVKSSELESLAADLTNVRESLTFPVMVVDRLLRVTGANRACKRVAEMESLLDGRPLSAVEWRIPAFGLYGAIEQTISTGQRVNQVIESADGAVFQLSLMPYRTARGEIDGAVLAFEDVTEQAEARQALERSERNFRNLYSHSPIGKCTLTADLRFAMVNPRMCKMLGRHEDDLIGTSGLSAILPEDEPLFGSKLGELFAGKQSEFQCDMRIVQADGSPMWVAVTVGTLTEDGDGPPLAICSMLDIDQSRRDRSRIEELARRNRLATEAGRAGIWEIEKDSGQIQIDETMGRICGIAATGEPLAFDAWSARIAQEDRDRVIGVFRQAMQRQEPFDAEFQVDRPDGTSRHVELRAMVIDGAGEDSPRMLGTCTDITELHELSERLEDENRALEAALDEIAARAEENRLLAESSAHGVIALDPDGTIRSINSAVLAQFGYGEDELVDHKIEMLVPKPQRAGHPKLREKADIPETSYREMAKSREVHGLHKDGSTFPVDVQLRRTSGHLGQMVVASIYDLRPRIEHERVVEDARQSAEAANEAKSQFLATVSHEIRTPMNVVFGMLDLIGRSGLSEEQHGFVEKAQFATHTLRHLIDDVLDFSKIEADRLELEREPFSLVDLVNAVAEELSGTLAASNRALELFVEVDESLPDVVRGDALRLHQVLLNLTANAVKFTPRGSVTLGLKLVKRMARKVRLEFSVADTGIGIDKDKLEAIFEGFFQAEASTTRRYGGTGLGLAISQKLVQLMGGTIAVESELDKGSRFYFQIDLPLAKADTLAPAITDAIHGTRGLRVLIVDDSQETCEIISRMADELGWHADAVSSGAEAVARISDIGGQTLPYDLLLIDWRMPHMDGWDTARRIRALGDGTQSAVFVLVSAFDLDDFRRRVQSDDNPFDGFVNKPIKLAILLRLAFRVLRKRVEMRHEEEGMTGPDGQRLHGLRVLVAEDFPLNQDLMRSLLEHEGAQADIAEDGRKALAMVDAAETPYDIVLMDIQMPELDGYDACREMRRSHSADLLPVLAITANAQQADRDRCLAAGMNDYVSKPIDIDDLVAKIRELTGARVARALPLDDFGDGEAGGQLVDAQQLERTRRLLSGGPGGGAIERHIAAIDALLAGIEAAVGAQDFAVLAEQCHTLCSGAGNLGAEALAQLAGKLEGQARAKSTSAWEDAGNLLDLGRRTTRQLRDLCEAAAARE